LSDARNPGVSLNYAASGHDGIRITSSAGPDQSIAPANAPFGTATDQIELDNGLDSLVSTTAERIQHRATIISTFAALNGTEAPVRDVTEFLWTHAPGDLSITALARALDSTGIRHKIRHNAEIKPETWPALTMMTNGQCVLVLSQVENVLTVYDDTCADNRIEVPMAEFESMFSGSILTGRPPRDHDRLACGEPFGSGRCAVFLASL